MPNTTPANDLSGLSVFLSASIPDESRWQGSFRALEITDAVVALTRAVLQRGGRLVTAAHPTIAPLMLYVAAENDLAISNPVVIYQSAVFDPILPEATLRFEAAGIGRIVRTAAIANEPPNPALAPRSLEHMRREMMTTEAPAAAVFIGGMDGISAEYKMFRELRESSPTYAFGQPGGAAGELVLKSPQHLTSMLTSSTVYPVLCRKVLDDLAGRHSTPDDH